MKKSIKGIVRMVIATAMSMAVMLPMTAQADNVIGTYSTGSFLDTGGCFSRTFNRGIGTGYRSANVQLSGWSLQYVYSDHHIRNASVYITGVYYNQFTGNLSFTVSGCYYDQNADDDFYWSVNYTVVAQT